MAAAARAGAFSSVKCSRTAPRPRNLQGKPKSIRPSLGTLLLDVSPCATRICFRDDSLVVNLDDGRVLAVPLEWFPNLRDATAEQRNNWQMIGGGYGMHWPELDEDLSVFGLLNPQQGARKAG